MSGIEIDVRHDLASFSARLALMQEDRLAAAVRALNRTMTTVRKEAAKEMADEYPGMRIAALKRQMRLQRATRGHAAAVLTFSAKRFRLFANFKMRAFGQFGVRFSRLPWRIETGSGDLVTPEMLKRAFRQRSGASGVPNVWVRLGKDRFPIEVLVAPSLAAAFVQRKIGASLARLARTRFGVVFAQEAKFRLSKGK